jgi:hypothetical protein
VGAVRREYGYEVVERWRSRFLLSFAFVSFLLIWMACTYRVAEMGGRAEQSGEWRVERGEGALQDTGCDELQRVAHRGGVCVHAETQREARAGSMQGARG